MSKGQTATNTKVITRTIRSMAKEHSTGRVETNTLAIICLIKDMAMVKCSGKMGLTTKEIGSMVYNMGKDLLGFLVERSKQVSSRTMCTLVGCSKLSMIGLRTCSLRK